MTEVYSTVIITGRKGSLMNENCDMTLKWLMIKKVKYIFLTFCDQSANISQNYVSNLKHVLKYNQWSFWPLCAYNLGVDRVPEIWVSGFGSAMEKWV